ncbi:MAG: TPM domain-containing protein [Patescibacteria group bacterium]
MSRLFVVIASLAFAVRIFAATGIPAPTGHINDFAGVLRIEEKQSIEQTLVSYQESSGNEIAVALIRSLEGDTVEEKAVRLFEEWKIGKKGKDNGVLFLAAIDDRKMRIEVGYGLEPYLTDGDAGEILRNDVTPAFREGKYGLGVSNALASIEKELSGSAGEANKPTPTAEQFPIPFWMMIFLFIYLCSFMARSKTVWLGGAAGAIAGVGFGSWLGSVSMSVVLAIFLSLVGLLLDAILSRNYEVTKKSGGKNGFFHTGGGFWSGGSGGSSGSFGGFSGGSSGGGGSSSSW